MRKVTTPNEIFDILDDIEGRKFATIGYITGANLDMPKEKRLNPETNRMKSFDDYKALGKQLGYDDEIGGIVKLTSYTLQLANRKQMAKDYEKYKSDVNDIRAKYGIEPIVDKENGYTKTINYGKSGVSVYGGEDEAKRDHVYHPANTFGAQIKSTYYILDKDGSIDRECDKEELKDMLKSYSASDSGVAALKKMGAEESKIQEYIQDVANLKMSYKNFEYSSILYIVATVNGEKIIYINNNLNRTIGQVNVNPSEFMVIVKARYADDLSDVPTSDGLTDLDEEEDREMQDIPFMSETDDFEKAMTLMKEAIKQYEEGKYSLANHSRKEANRFFDKMEDELSSEEGIEKSMYGECRNFGLIYRVIEENANALYETAEGRNKIGKVLNYIKANPILMNEFRVYDAFTRPVNIENAEIYVNEAISLVERCNKQQIVENNSKLIKFIKSLGLDEKIHIGSTDMKLYESIEYALLNKPTISNVQNYTEIKKTICESVRNNNRQIKNVEDVDNIQESRIGEITEKYSRDLNDDEISLLEDIALSDKKAEKRFNEIKSNLLSDLQDKINESENEDKEGWKEIYETVSKKSFDKNTVLATIGDMVSLKETLL